MFHSIQLLLLCQTSAISAPETTTLGQVRAMLSRELRKPYRIPEQFQNAPCTWSGLTPSEVAKAVEIALGGTWQDKGNEFVFAPRESAFAKIGEQYIAGVKSLTLPAGISAVLLRCDLKPIATARQFWQKDFPLPAMSKSEQAEMRRWLTGGADVGEVPLFATVCLTRNGLQLRFILTPKIGETIEHRLEIPLLQGPSNGSLPLELPEVDQPWKSWNTWSKAKFPGVLQKGQSPLNPIFSVYAQPLLVRIPKSFVLWSPSLLTLDGDGGKHHPISDALTSKNACVGYDQIVEGECTVFRPRSSLYLNSLPDWRSTVKLFDTPVADIDVLFSSAQLLNSVLQSDYFDGEDKIYRAYWMEHSQLPLVPSMDQHGIGFLGSLPIPARNALVAAWSGRVKGEVSAASLPSEAIWRLEKALTLTGNSTDNPNLSLLQSLTQYRKDIKLLSESAQYIGYSIQTSVEDIVYVQDASLEKLAMQVRSSAKYHKISSELILSGMTIRQERWPALRVTVEVRGEMVGSFLVRAGAPAASRDLKVAELEPDELSKFRKLVGLPD